MTSSRVACDIADHVATLTFHNPPHNSLDTELVQHLADRLEALDDRTDCRAIVLGSKGDVFCAGADFSGIQEGASVDPQPFYDQAMRLYRNRKPIVAAVQGAAIGAGLGLALVADFRVGSPSARFSANFNRLGIHPGFGVSHALPSIVGVQHASWMLYTGERVAAQQALAMGLIDAVADDRDAIGKAQAMARQIALSAPGAVQSTRRALRAAYVEAIVAANRQECAAQREQFRHPDFLEGVRAAAQRRAPVFAGG